MTKEPEDHGYIAFWKGKHFALSAKTTDAAKKIAAKHFGVTPSRAWQIHLEEAPVDRGSN